MKIHINLDFLAYMCYYIHIKYMRTEDAFMTDLEMFNHLINSCKSEPPTTKVVGFLPHMPIALRCKVLHWLVI